MKKILAIIGALLLAVAVNGQTNTLPPVTTNSVPTLPEYVNTWIDFLGSTSSSWVVAPFAIYVDESDKLGGGFAAMYEVSPYVLTGLRMDFFDDSVFMPSIGVQLQLPIKLAGKVTVTPFALTGLATPLGGGIEQDTEAVAIVGAGMAVGITKKIGLVYDAEAWTGFSGTQHRFGVYWKF